MCMMVYGSFVPCREVFSVFSVPPLSAVSRGDVMSGCLDTAWLLTRYPILHTVYNQHSALLSCSLRLTHHCRPVAHQRLLCWCPAKCVNGEALYQRWSEAASCRIGSINT